MASALQSDPEVHRVVEQLRSSAGNDRRDTSREPFPAIQHIAPADGENMPKRTAFFPIRCHDLSTRGFSFFANEQPQFSSLVLALRTATEVIYLAAEVRHCTEALVYPSGRVEVLGGPRDGADCKRARRDGAEHVVLVGCEFARRLDWEESQGPFDST